MAGRCDQGANVFVPQPQLKVFAAGCARRAGATKRQCNESPVREGVRNWTARCFTQLQRHTACLQTEFRQWSCIQQHQHGSSSASAAAPACTPPPRALLYLRLSLYEGDIGLSFLKASGRPPRVSCTRCSLLGAAQINSASHLGQFSVKEKRLAWRSPESPGHSERAVAAATSPTLSSEQPSTKLCSKHAFNCLWRLPFCTPTQHSRSIKLTQHVWARMTVCHSHAPTLALALTNMHKCSGHARTAWGREGRQARTMWTPGCSPSRKPGTARSRRASAAECSCQLMRCTALLDSVDGLSHPAVSIQGRTLRAMSRSSLVHDADR